MDKRINKQINFLSSDESEQSDGEPDSIKDVFIDYHLAEMLPQPVPLPTITVTPVLEDYPQQVKDFHDPRQQIRNVTAHTNMKHFTASTLNPLLAQVARLSASCPALNEAVLELETLGDFLESSPMHQSTSRKRSAQDWLCQPVPQRRRSLTNLQDLSDGKEEVIHRQRSSALSSMESEIDGCWGDGSTYSLNEADLQNDFIKVKAKCEAEQLRLMPIQLPLQKSVSTPSINAVRDPVSEPASLAGAQSTLPIAVYDHHSEKRQKRGGSFFRKRKDKNKKVAHQWISACYGSSHNCDYCNKPLSNKPALYCKNCTTTVHQNSCKDHSAECNKSSKSSKNSNRIANFAVTNLANHKVGPLSKRSSGSFSGSNQVPINSITDEASLVPLEFLFDAQIIAADLCLDFSLGLHHVSEPDSWTSHVGKEIAKKLKEKEVKRQEHIYEFILTEKHHCMTLLVMQKIFMDGLQKYFNLGTNLERMFPRLNDLIDLHLNLLSRLRHRQREAPVVTSIADILLDEFSNPRAARLKSAYGEFCSQHRDAVELYKGYMQGDPRFGQFVRHCQQNPLLKKKGIPECILFVTQRLTKYPLLIEPLIKTSKENKPEQEALQRALALVKEILVEVDAQVAEKENEDRKLEIYDKIDAKSHTIHRNNNFQKSDILQGNRALRFEGVAMLMQGRGKMQIVLVIVLSDVLFFLQENNNKYTFFTPDNKAGVVSLQKLLVREKAGQESREIYLISSNPADPVMFELKVHKPKDKQTWINAIRNTVQNCPEDKEESSAITAEEKENHKQLQIPHVSDSRKSADQQEELRSLLDKLSAEKAAWAIKKQQEAKVLEEERKELLKLREQIRADQKYIQQQREQLYRF